MEFEQYEQKLTAEDLAAFEQQYNITLPKAFKEHYNTTEVILLMKM